MNAKQAATNTRAKNDAAIIEDLLDDERETLAAACDHERRGLSPYLNKPLHDAAARPLVLAGLLDLDDVIGTIATTPRGQRIARRLSA